MWKGIHAVRPGAQLGDIGYAIQRHAQTSRVFGGPRVLRPWHRPGNARDAGSIALGTTEDGYRPAGRNGIHHRADVEPGHHACRTEEDGWTVVTADGKLSPQFEHTVAVTRKGVQMLTLRPEEGFISA